MSGIQPVGAMNPSNYAAMSGGAYPLALDGNALVALRSVGRFAPRQNPNPTMSLLIDPGYLFDGVTLTEVGGWFGTNFAGAAFVNPSLLQVSTLPNGAAIAGVSSGMSVVAYNYVNGVLNSLLGNPSNAFVNAVTSGGPLAGSSFTYKSVSAASLGTATAVIVGQAIGAALMASTLNGTNVVTGLPSTSCLFVGMAVAGNAFVPANTTISSIDSASQIHISNAATGSGTVSLNYTIPIPVSNPRVDRVVLNNTTGVATWIKGTEATNPTAPAIPYGSSPCCQIMLLTSTTAITATSNIIDERDLTQLGSPTLNSHKKETHAPTTGFSITVTDGNEYVLFNPAGTLATGTLTTPPNPIDGQRLSIGSSQTITSFTLAANAGQTVLAAPTGLSAGQRLAWIYDLATTSWFGAN